MKIHKNAKNNNDEARSLDLEKLYQSLKAINHHGENNNVEFNYVMEMFNIVANHYNFPIEFITDMMEQLQLFQLLEDFLENADQFLDDEDEAEDFMKKFMGIDRLTNEYSDKE